jgi:hypothetical protein
MKTFTRFIILFAAILSSSVAFALSKAEIIQLLDAKMSEEVILNLVYSNPSDVEISAMDLVELKSKGASDSLLNALINPKSGSIKMGEGNQNPKRSGDQYDPEEVLYYTGNQYETMSYIIPNQRTAARGLGFGGVATYSVLNGPQAQVRIPSNTPEFIVSVPEKAQPGSYITLASFAVRKNGSREVLVGGGYVSYSTGIHPDRIMKIGFEQMEDQSKATENYVLYKVKTLEPLLAGEYAIVLSTANYSIAGFFGGQTNSCFDFGIDEQYGAQPVVKETKNPIGNFKSLFGKE